MKHEAKASRRPLTGGASFGSMPPTASTTPMSAMPEGDPRPASLQPVAEPDRQDRDHGRVEVDDERRERRRHGLERRVIRAGVADIQDAQADPGDGPPDDPGNAAPGADPPTEQEAQVNPAPNRNRHADRVIQSTPGGVDGLGEQRAGAERGGRDEHERDPARAAAIHSVVGSHPLRRGRRRCPVQS